MILLIYYFLLRKKPKRNVANYFKNLDSILKSRDITLATKVCHVFDWENAIALDTMQGNRASSRRDGKVSWVFSSCGRNLGIFSSYSGDVHSKL